MQNNELDRLLLNILQEHPQCSDINFTVGRKPHAEIHGELKPLQVIAGDGELTADHTQALADCLMRESPALQQALGDSGGCDCAHSLADGRRFRVNIFRARGKLSLVLRLLPQEIPSLESLKLPPILNEISPLRNGMVLVTGSTGSGKSTTLAAIIDAINATRAVHVVTLEDPVEFSHPSKKAILNQRELGLDFPNFSDGLRAALRQAPKVILVGEMRDRVTMEIALKAAETGHLVLSTLHTVDAGQTIERVVSMFDKEERPLIRSRLAQTLRFVVGQRLLPKVEGGRLAALEIMGSSLRTRELILGGEQGDKTFLQVIHDAIPLGWQTFDHHIVKAYEEGVISEEVALAYCSDLSVVRRELDQVKAARGEETSDLGELKMEIRSSPTDW